MDPFALKLFSPIQNSIDPNFFTSEHSFNLQCLAGDAADKHVIIVDDLVQTGGTQMECAKVHEFVIEFSIQKFIKPSCLPSQNFLTSPNTSSKSRNITLL